jgi:type I restriction enzyme S subunit
MTSDATQVRDGSPRHAAQTAAQDVPPGYKRTEVGVIPEDWEVSPLGDLGEALIGLTYKPSDVREHGTLVLRASNIQNDALTFDDNVFVDCSIPERIMARPGDVLICVRNGSRQLIGKTALLDERTVGMTFGAFMAIYRSPIGTLVSYLFQSDILKRQISEHLGATINQITNKSLNSFRIPVSPLELEQRAIAEALSDVDGLLGALEALIAKKRAIKQAAMQQLLTGKTRLPGFGGEWETKRLGTVLTVRHGRSQKEVEVSHGPYPILATGGQIGTASRPLYDKPSVLIGRKGTIDQPQYMDTPFWTVDTLFYCEMVEDHVARFFFYRFWLVDWARYNEASGVPSLNARTIEQIEVACPKPAEQAAIAAVLSAMDAEIAALEARREKTRQIKQGMMQQLLTGRVRLVKPEAAA